LPQLTLVTAGQVEEAPLQMPGGVARPREQEPALHVRPVLKASGGQSAVLPLQLSGSSQIPFAERHWTPLNPGVKTQPVADAHESTVHGLPSSQTRAGPPTQSPPEHLSPVVHASPSSQAAVLFECWQPAVVEQVSVVQGFWSSHDVAGPPRHAPAEQWSPLVHALPSLHALVSSLVA
jgi:hypothetical protein